MNQLKPDEAITIKGIKGDQVTIPRDKIKSSVDETKQLFNKLTNKMDTQYGFYLKKLIQNK